MSQAPKDPVGVTMRLVYKTILTEVEFATTKTQDSLKLMFALQRQIDGKLEQYFSENPGYAPGLQMLQFNRFAHFMRKVHEWRRWGKICNQSKTPDNFYRRDAARVEVERDVKKFFGERPDQAPTPDLLQLKFTNDLHRVEAIETQQQFLK